MTVHPLFWVVLLSFFFFFPEYLLFYLSCVPFLGGTFHPLHPWIFCNPFHPRDLHSRCHTLSWHLTPGGMTWVLPEEFEMGRKCFTSSLPSDSSPGQEKPNLSWPHSLKEQKCHSTRGIVIKHACRRKQRKKKSLFFFVLGHYNRLDLYNFLEQIITWCISNSKIIVVVNVHGVPSPLVFPLSLKTNCVLFI